jgi:hypothetical protein
MNLPNPFRWLVRRFRSGPARRPIRNDNRFHPRLEEFEPILAPTASWTQMASPPSGGVSQLLLRPDGEVMALGGAGKTWYMLTADSAGNYSSAGATWTAAASMSTNRSDFVANVLPDDKVLVLGGEHSGPNGFFTFTSMGEIYDPVANTFTDIDPFPGSVPSPNPGNFGGGPAPSELIQDANGHNQILVGSFWSPQTYLLDWTASAGSQWFGPEAADGNFRPIYKLDEAGTAPASPLDPNGNTGDASGEEGAVKLPDGSVLTYDLGRSNHNLYGAAFKAERLYCAPKAGPPNGGF